MFRMLSVLVLISTAVFLTSCGKKAKEEAASRAIEKAIEKQTGGKAKVDLSKGKVTIKDKEGELTMAQGGGADLPEGFPKDVLAYKGAQVMLAVKQANSMSVVLETKDDLKTVEEAYKTSMKAQGWEEETAMTMPEGVMHHYKKANRKASVTINKDPGKSRITLIVESEKE